MFGEPAPGDPLDWQWVDAELVASETYWITASGAGPPHPRPVWGIWSVNRLHLSVGSLRISRDLEPGTHVTVHLPSGTDVVIVEGVFVGRSADTDLIASYIAKYDWDYDVGQYGPLTSIAAKSVLSWRTIGPAGRDGFAATGSWQFGDN